MSSLFEELDWRSTRLGEISLRRRLEPTLNVEVYEVKLGDEFLMSSLFTVGETALADLGLAACNEPEIDVVIGGLGLGYTARATLGDPRVRSVRVVEALDEVIDWHRRDLVPGGLALASDPRCVLVHGDFLETVAMGSRFGAGSPARHDVILVDIDHTPGHVLHPSHAAFYEPAGLRRLRARLVPGGVFALWSDDPPDDRFVATVQRVFRTCEANEVSFANPLTGGRASSTVYVATAGDEQG
ncbi:MAG: spermidine synthase [Actinomycetota bacterium]